MQTLRRTVIGGGCWLGCTKIMVLFRSRVFSNQYTRTCSAGLAHAAILFGACSWRYSWSCTSRLGDASAVRRVCVRTIKHGL